MGTGELRCFLLCLSASIGIDSHHHETSPSPSALMSPCVLGQIHQSILNTPLNSRTDPFAGKHVIFFIIAVNQVQRKVPYSDLHGSKRFCTLVLFDRDGRIFHLHNPKPDLQNEEIFKNVQYSNSSEHKVVTHDCKKRVYLLIKIHEHIIPVEIPNPELLLFITVEVLSCQ